jgi:hypothetical protein
MLFLASSNRLAGKFYLPNHRRLHPCFTLERCCVRCSQSSKTFPKASVEADDSPLEHTDVFRKKLGHKGGSSTGHALSAVRGMCSPLFPM